MQRFRKSMLFMFVNIIIYTHAQWNITTISNPALPREDFNQVVGYHSGTIYMFGGENYPNAWSEYVISTNSVIDRGSNHLLYAPNGKGQYYTQMNDKLYYLVPNGIYFYDYISHTNLTTLMIPNIHSCLTSHHDLLFVLGGLSAGDVQVFNTSSSQWIARGFQLNIMRREAACAVDARRGIVYAIGGGDTETGWRPDFETLLIGDNITQTQWILKENGLFYGTWGLRAVYIEHIDSMLVVGGGLGATNISSIDCATGSIISVGKLNYPVQAGGLVLVDHILYLFAGLQTNTWQRMTNPLLLGTKYPTKAPSDDPTEAPSDNPTEAPSYDPTEAPSDPTEAPSYDPSEAPSYDPTEAPSDPTEAPSDDPTEAPSNDPTEAPSYDPTVAPSDPTEAPSDHPTEANSVITNYEVSIDITSCDGYDGANSHNANSHCDFDQEVVQQVTDIIKRYLTAENNVEVLSVDIVGEDLVIRLSVTTPPHNVLKPDTISHHIEREIEDNEIEDLGGVKTDVIKEDKGINKQKQIAMERVIVYSIIGAAIVGCCAILCVFVIIRRKKRRVLQQQLAHIQTTSTDARAPGTADVTDGANTKDEHHEQEAEQSEVNCDTDAPKVQVTTGGDTDVNVCVLETPGAEQATADGEEVEESGASTDENDSMYKVQETAGGDIDVNACVLETTGAVQATADVDSYDGEEVEESDDDDSMYNNDYNVRVTTTGGDIEDK